MAVSPSSPSAHQRAANSPPKCSGPGAPALNQEVPLRSRLSSGGGNLPAKQRGSRTGTGSGARRGDAGRRPCDEGARSSFRPYCCACRGLRCRRRCDRYGRLGLHFQIVQCETSSADSPAPATMRARRSERLGDQRPAEPDRSPRPPPTPPLAPYPTAWRFSASLKKSAPPTRAQSESRSAESPSTASASYQSFRPAP